MVIEIKGDLDAQIKKAGKRLCVVDFSATWLVDIQGLSITIFSICALHFQLGAVHVKESRDFIIHCHRSTLTLSSLRY